MADIGTDHGRLPTWLVASGKVPRAVAIDDKEGPLAGARARFEREGVADRVDGRLASGCAGLDDGVRTVTICGMGGASIAAILEGVPATVTRLVLNPNTEPARVRTWLAANGWAIDAERLLRERGRWFAVFTARRGEGSGAFLDWGDPAVHLDRDALDARLAEERAVFTTILAATDVPAVAARLHALDDTRRALARLTPRA